MHYIMWMAWVLFFLDEIAWAFQVALGLVWSFIGFGLGSCTACFWKFALLITR